LPPKKKSLDATRNVSEAPWHFCLITIACIVNYIQTLGYYPVYDDVEFIDRNPITHAPFAVWKIFSSTYTGLVRADITYRPLTVWTFALNRGFNSMLNMDPMSPYSFHLVNLFLHTCVACLFYRLLRLLEQTPMVSLAAALVFAVLPIHTEAVTGIVGRAELMACVFGLLFVVGHFAGWSAILCCLMYLLSMFGKESGMTFLGVVFALDFFFASRRWNKRYWTYLGTLAVWLFVRYTVVHDQKYILAFIDNPTMAANGLQRFLTASRFQIEYLSRALFPYYLSSDNSYNQIPIISNPLNEYVLGFLAVTGGLAVWAWKVRKSQALVPAFCLVYASTFALTSNFIISIGSTVGERLAYTPSLAICVLLVIAISSWRGIDESSKAFKIIVFGLVVIYSGVTINRNFSWKDELTFFSTQVKTAPNSAKAHYNFGTILAKYNHEDQAIAEYETAIRIYPAYSEAFFNLGNALRRTQGPAEKIIDAYQKTVRFDPGHQNAMGNLMIYLVQLGRVDDARQVASQLHRLNPQHPALLYFAKNVGAK
jgi:protein O-mannosyl-transferase